MRNALIQSPASRLVSFQKTTMAATVQFDHIYHELQSEVGSESLTCFPVGPNAHRQTEFRVATSGMAWKGQDSEGVIAMPSADIKWAQWIRVARNFQLRVGMRDHRREKFDGFMREVRSNSYRHSWIMLTSPPPCRIMTGLLDYWKIISASPWKLEKFLSKGGTGV